MFPVIFWNIFNVGITNPFFTAFAVIYVVVLSFVFAKGFIVILWNHFAALNLIILRNLTAATFFARNLFFHATLCVICARLIVAIHAPAITCFHIPTRMISRSRCRSASSLGASTSAVTSVVVSAVVVSVSVSRIVAVS